VADRYIKKPTVGIAGSLEIKPVLFLPSTKIFAAPHFDKAQSNHVRFSIYNNIPSIAPAQQLNPALLFFLKPLAILCLFLMGRWS
jgi:uncharacterized membrane protein